MDAFTIDVDDPRRDDVQALLVTHLGFAYTHTPVEHAHALDLHGLLDPAITFFSARSGGKLLAIGAIRQLEPTHGELKSMHTVQHARGRGIGRAMVFHLLAVARERGYERVSLETGTMDAFAAARALYAGAGFTECEPFGDYRPSDVSTFMTIALRPQH